MKSQQLRRGGLAIVGVLVLTWLVVQYATTLESLTVTASVEFTGTQFIITNNDGHDWFDVRMTVNTGTEGGGYETRAIKIEAGSTHTTGAATLARADGLRFNPITIKPINFQITARPGQYDAAAVSRSLSFR